MLYNFLKLLSYIVCKMPHFVSYTFGVALGNVCWLFIPRRRREMAIENIMRGLALERDAAYNIAKKSSVRFGPMFMEVLAMPLLNKQNINEYVVFEGQEYLEEALRPGKGAILATAHSGNWELLGAALALCGFPLVAVAQRQTNAVMDTFINEIRKNAGMHVAYKQEIREMIRLLSDGKLIGLLIDQDAHNDGVFVNFFGRIASAPQGAAVFSRMKGVPIVPAFITQTAPGKHKAIIYKPICVEKTADREADILHATQQLTEIIEAHILKYPDEWFWLHNRWKTRPQNEN